jgi:hypothetical protein
MELLIMRSLTLNYYQDPGHGWVKISLAKLQQLGLADSISYYSYMRGDYAYLEEDCDLGRLYQAADKAGITIKLREHWTNNRSKIRGYKTYKSPAQQLAAEAALKAKIRAQGCSLDFIENRMIIKVIG